MKHHLPLMTNINISGQTLFVNNNRSEDFCVLIVGHVLFLFALLLFRELFSWLGLENAGVTLIGLFTNNLYQKLLRTIISLLCNVRRITSY